ncbi:BCCT family transporter [Nocardioides currus]|uniref:Glycine/betaine ABC transporter permease n=1 Tax=Nocardioides currus TaxID=2133958 RepID=A0A2R7Z2V4_9ACTN|nr:BCCT family transporter [Nocardioides currus]PUA82566.1 glycine/betaine ABC transporter permease [Nocardioides currus]
MATPVRETLPGSGDEGGHHRTGRLPLDKVTFGVAAAIAVAFLLWGTVDSEGMGTGTGEALAWLEKSFGWLFILVSAGFLLFSGYLALSRYGNIKLGPDDSEPEFSTFSWVSMMFATGMGIGLMFWGVAEPLTYLTATDAGSIPPGRGDPSTPDSARVAMEYAFFHWGFHPWSMYAVIGLAIGYFAYRKGAGNLVSGTFGPLLGRRATEGPGKAIDVIAIFATLFGSATSLGLGALQITGGLDDVFSSGESKWLTVGVIAVLTTCFVLSAVTGIEKGVQFLSNANAIAAVLLVFFLFVVGPTVFILSTFTESLGGYLTHLPTMAFRTGAFGGSEFLSTWTIFYWAWWISWTPFVGMFIARISKGRTIRQFVVYVILVPSVVSFVWFSILAGAAFDLQLSGARDLGAVLAEEGTESALFTTLREYPLASVTVVLAVFLVAIFFITGADSASIVMGMLSQHGEEEPMRWLVVFWGVAQGAVAAVLLFSGGLGALQTLVIIVAGPFMLIIVAMCVSLMKALRAEPYESTLPSRVRRAVLHAQKYDLVEQQTVALASLGADPTPEDASTQSATSTTSSARSSSEVSEPRA